MDTPGFRPLESIARDTARIIRREPAEVAIQKAAANAPVTVHVHNHGGSGKAKEAKKEEIVAKKDEPPKDEPPKADEKPDDKKDD